MDTDDGNEVIAEYPVYAASIRAICSQNEDMRLVQLQYPMRPPWRGYDLEHVEEVTYKPNHRMLRMTLPEDGPAGVGPPPSNCSDLSDHRSAVSSELLDFPCSLMELTSGCQAAAGCRKHRCVPW